MATDPNRFDKYIPATGGGAPRGRGLLPSSRPAPQKAPETPEELHSRQLADEIKALEIRREQARADAASSGGELKIEQSKAAGFLGRMINSDALYGQGVDPRSPSMQQLADLTPENFSNAYQSTPEQRAAKTYVEDFIRAKLRLESGAAIGANELQREYPIYFPMPGDQPPDLERKAGMRKQAIASMQVQAGPAAKEIGIVGGKGLGTEILPVQPGAMGEGIYPKVQTDQSATDLMAGLGGGAPGTEHGPRPGGPVVPNDAAAVASGGTSQAPLNPQQIALYDKWRMENPKPSAPQLVEFFNSIGAPIDPRRAEEIAAAVAAGAVQAPGSAATGGEPPAPPGPAPRPLTEDMTAGENFTVPDWLKDVGMGTARAAGTFVEGLGNAPGVIANPIAAGVNYAAGRDVMGKADYGENLRETLGLPKMTGLTGEIAEAASGAFGGAGLFGKAAQVVTNPSALAAFTTMAKEPIRQTLGAVTGALGSIGARKAGLPWWAQLAANVAGNVAGYGGSKVVAPGKVGDPALAQAATEMDVPISQPLIKGNQRAINRAGIRDQDPLTATRIQDPLAKTQTTIGERLTERVGPGTAPDKAQVGADVRQTAKNIVGKEEPGQPGTGLGKRASDKLYANAEKASGDPLIDQVEMRAKIDAKIAELMKNPSVNKAEIAALKVYRKDISTAKPLSYLRQLRTTINDNISGTDLNRSAAQRRADAHMSEIVSGANKDIEAALQGSPEALALWKKADANYARQMTFKNDVLSKFIGKNIDALTDEQIANKLLEAAKNDHAGLAALYRRIPKAQKERIASFLANTLGKTNADAPFSPDRFLTQGGLIGSRQRVTLFGEKGAEAFENLMLLSRRLQMGRAEINRSKNRGIYGAVTNGIQALIATVLTTGGAALGAGTMGGAEGALVGGVGGATLAGTAKAISGGRRIISADNLMNPKVSLALAEAAAARDPESWMASAARIASLIARDPGLQETLGPLQQELEKAGGKKRDINALQAEDTSR